MTVDRSPPADDDDFDQEPVPRTMKAMQQNPRGTAPSREYPALRKPAKIVPDSTEPTDI